MSRQVWLRTRDLPSDPVDPVPMEAAQLDSRADTMREMVRDQVAGMVRATLAEREPDEDFIDDDFLDEPEVPEMTDYQAVDLALSLPPEDLSAPPGAPRGGDDPAPKETPLETDPEAPQEPPSATA